MLNETRMRTFLPVFAIVLATGCTGDLVELTNNGGGSDMAVAIDMAGQAQGGEMGPSSAKFSPDIQADLDAKGCTLGACHGTMGNGSVMYVKAMATAQADIDANYMSVSNEINLTMPAMSPLVVQPSGPVATTGHAGGQVFPTGTNDPTYMKWLAWIQAGAPKQ